MAGRELLLLPAEALVRSSQALASLENCRAVLLLLLPLLLLPTAATTAAAAAAACTLAATCASTALSRRLLPVVVVRREALAGVGGGDCGCGTRAAPCELLMRARACSRVLCVKVGGAEGCEGGMRA